MSALEGLRVVEIGEFFSAAYCTKLLADLGASVIKVEPSGGDMSRAVGPFPPGLDPQSPEACEWSGTHLYLNAGKHGLTADWTSADGQAAIERLLHDADVFVTNTSVAVLAKAALDPQSVRARHPHLIYASISPFGSWGPYSSWRAYGLNAEATGGGGTIGDPEREPLHHPSHQVHVQGGAHAAAAVLAAVHGGRGQWIDVSEADLWAYHIGGGAINTWVFHSRARRRRGRHSPNPYPAGAYACKDGLITEVTIRGAEWKRYLLVLGDGEIPAWSKDPRYADRRQNSLVYREELDARQAPWLMAHTREEIFAIARKNRLPFAPVYRMDEVVAHEHLNTRDFFIGLPLPDGGSVAAPGAPYILSGSPWAASSPAPRLGEQATFTARPRLGQRAEAASAAGSGPLGGLPLTGLTVLDMSAVIAGPQCARMLADMGARVIKVESRLHPDSMRTSENNVDGNPEHDSMFHFMNRNKLGITLNIRSLAGRQLFLRLAERADVLIENFAARMMPERCLDYRTLSARNDQLIMLSMPGAGDTGPLRDMVSYASCVNAVSGLDSLAGYPGEEPMTVGGAYCDWSSSVHGSIAVLAALRYRERTGRGQYINLSQWETAVAGLGPAVLRYTLGGIVPEAIGNRDPYLAPHGVYPALDPDTWVAIVCGSEAEWQALRAAMADPPWSREARFATRSDRLAHVYELDRQIAAWCRERQRDEIVAALQAAGVAATPVLELGERWLDPHFNARDGFLEVEHPSMGPIIMGGAPWKFSETPVEVKAPGPFLGQHNTEIYGGWLGLSQQEIADLEEARVIY
jgi:crotonobetainyl-CoA:carnitine CoA-transferase CaiB-like acyl-CoA transferase